MIRFVPYLTHNIISKIFNRLAATDADASTDTAI